MEVTERSHDGHHLSTIDALLFVHLIRVPGAWRTRKTVGRAKQA
jgi:hypothetical protein